jgi:osmotically-inducible protein OsmY
MKKLFLSITLISCLSACVETLVIGSVATTHLVVREKTILDTKDDVNISSKILQKFSTSGLKVPGNAIDVIVNEKRVLLTGIVSDPSLAKKAVELAWKVSQVKEVINEIQIAKNKSRLNGFRTYSKDAIITTQIESRSFFTSDISLINVKINTVNSVVYLLGVANSEYEIERITGLIAKTKGVKGVVSHIIRINDERRA